MPAVKLKVLKKGEKMRQYNIRMPSDLTDRLDETALILGRSASDLLRQILIENLPEHEERARASGRVFK